MSDFALTNYMKTVQPGLSDHSSALLKRSSSFTPSMLKVTIFKSEICITKITYF